MKLPRLALLAAIALGACGGGNANQPAPTLATSSAQPNAAPLTPAALEADPLGLFPSGALGMFSVDLRAFYTSQSAGPAAAQLAEKYFPVGAEAGFSASRDLDRVMGGFYSMQGADVLATLVGRFDEAKIRAAADGKTQLRGGGLLVASQYADRTMYTVADAGFAVLTPHLVLAGTKTTIKRALDRMRDRHFAHDAPAWMLQTLATPGAAASLAVDTKSMPLANLTGGFPLKGTDGMTAVRLLANFQAPGMHVAGAATYADEAHAQAGAAGLSALASSAAFNVLTSAVGVAIRDVKITPAKNDAQIAFVVDDASLRNLLSRLPAVIGGG
ncbi:MAG TPA: hypothetical protein VGH28_08900 [Polyangiaceae bacterium]